MSDWWRFWLMGAMWTLFGYLLRRCIELHNERAALMEEIWKKLGGEEPPCGQ